ncbi:hypothetical protein J7I94_19110 [Streptomyces sp. ISL-12]|uniref:hypothetical protein n=1 Tax=Streptomyces sp. ISL-12 TaxID=2819177 RepID=UPI001BE7DA77|nr:hypothetical protein [Streptomyces sp. ISL-12]MBT2412644.1 hypothetical protein [Streptomyces sp. ISL-12]
MPRNDSYNQGIPYPVLGDAADIETATQTLVNGIVPKLVMRFSSAAARAAALSGDYAPVPGMITYLVAEDRWEGRTGEGKWLLLSDGPWRALTFPSGYTAFGGSPGWRYKAGGGIELRGRIQRINGGNLVDDGSETHCASVPSSIAPSANRIFIGASNRVTVSGVSRYTARIAVQPSGQITYNLENGGGTGTASDPAWICLDGIFFSPDGD